MDQFFIRFMREKFKLSKICKKNCEQAILSFMKYSAEDIRIDTFRKFLGIGDSRTRTEVLDCFLILLKNLPISFYRLFEDFESSNSFSLHLENCNEIYFQKFPNFYMHLESYDKLLRVTKIFRNDIELENIGHEEKKEIFYLDRYHSKSKEYFEDLLNQFKKGQISEIYYLSMAQQLMIINRDYELNLEKCIEIFNRVFEMKEDKINLEKFFEYFLTKYTIKLKVMEFIQISLESFCIIYGDLEKKMSNIWDKNLEIRNKTIMLYKDFEQVLLKLYGDPDNKWKFSEYFKYKHLILFVFFNDI